MISLKNVTIDFPVYNNFLAGELKRVIQRSRRFHLNGSALSSRTIITALRDISLTVAPGESLGLIGLNGAGKTTLLKTMAGIYKPTMGTISIEGRVRGFFNLSAGLDTALTGLENIQNLSYFYTKDPREIHSRLQEIVEFTGLGEFIYMPVSTYSSGMLARLLVSVAIHYDVEHLLFDEGLGAGDVQFLSKLSKRIARMVENAKTLVLASHSFPMLRQYCARAVILREGDLLFDGPIESAFEEYKRIYPQG